MTKIGTNFAHFGTFRSFKNFFDQKKPKDNFFSVHSVKGMCNHHKKLSFFQFSKQNIVKIMRKIEEKNQTKIHR